jgi:hypothetical protein
MAEPAVVPVEVPAISADFSTFLSGSFFLFQHEKSPRISSIVTSTVVGDLLQTTEIILLNSPSFSSHN